MATKNGIFIAERMASTGLTSLLRSATQSTAIENGSIITLGEKVAGKGLELHKAETVKKPEDTIYLVDGVELENDEQLTRGLEQFINPADKAFRVRKPLTGDTFSISESMVSGAVAGVKNLEAAVGNKLKEVGASATAGATQFRVVEKWNFGTKQIPMVRLEVL